MSDDIRDILQAIDEYEATPESFGMDLRLDLAKLVLEHLRKNNCTQSELSDRTGLLEPHISRIIHSNANCTFRTAGKVLWAFGIRARLTEVREPEDICYVEASAPDKLSELWHNWIESTSYGTEENDQEEARQGSTQTSVEFQGVGEAYRNL